MKHNNTANKENIKTEIERFANTTTQIENTIETMPTENAPFIEAVMDRVSECEEGIRHLQQMVTRINDLSEQYTSILESQLERIEDIKKVTTDLLQELALRQICSSTKFKIFREIAGNRLKTWESLHIVSFKNLESEKLKNIVNNDNDFNYFEDRWIRLKNAIGIKEDEYKLKRMYGNCVDDGNKIAHGHYKFTKSELSDFIMKQCQRGDKRNALFAFIEYDEKISQIRSENMYEFEWENHSMN